MAALGLVGATVALGTGLVAERHLANPSRAVPARPKADLPGRISLSPGRELVVTRPDGQVERVASMLAIPGKMRFGEFRWNETGVAPGKPWVRVDLDRQVISVFRAGQEIGTAVILFGARDKPTPTGWHTVLAKARDYHSRTYDAPMPYMLRLTDDGVALHASEVQEGRATHGCIGLPEAFAAKLFAAMSKGDPVLVVGGASAHS